MRVVVMITARAASSRLPRKFERIIHPLGGGHTGGSPELSLLQLVYVRCRKAEQPYEVTVVGPDDYVASFCQREFLNYCHVPPDNRDVTHQLLETAKRTEADIIVLVTGDCACVDPKIINESITELSRDPDIDLLHFGPRIKGFPVRVIRRDALEKTDQALRRHREHGVSYIDPRSPVWEGYSLDATWNSPMRTKAGAKLFNYSVDTQEDLDFIRAIYNRVPWDASMEDILECASDPEISAFGRAALSSARLAATTPAAKTSPSS